MKHRGPQLEAQRTQAQLRTIPAYGRIARSSLRVQKRHSAKMKASNPVACQCLWFGLSAISRTGKHQKHVAREPQFLALAFAFAALPLPLPEPDPFPFPALPPALPEVEGFSCPDTPKHAFPSRSKSWPGQALSGQAAAKF